MAIGTAITVSVLATMAVGSRELAKRLAGSGGSSKWVDRVQLAAGVGGASLGARARRGLFSGLRSATRSRSETVTGIFELTPVFDVLRLGHRFTALLNLRFWNATGCA